MRRLVHAEFTAALFDPILYQSTDTGSCCRLRCYGGPFRTAGLDDGDDETEPPASYPAEGRAYLDVIFKDDARTEATLTDLARDGKALEITVLYPTSHLPWFMKMLDRIESDGKVLEFFGFMEEPKPRPGLIPNTDALARVSDGTFETVFLSGAKPRIVTADSQGGPIQ